MTGRVGSAETGSRPSDQAPAGLGGSRFDPARVDEARVFLGPFLAVEGLTGQLLGKQAGAVYDAAVKALAYERDTIIRFLRSEADFARHAQGSADAGDPDKLYRMGEKDGLLLAALGVENGHHSAIAMEARRGGTPKSGPTAEGGDSAGRKASPK